MRARASDPRVVVPPQQWEFADARSIRLLPKGTKFTPISIYELWYEATEAKVLGIGFAATRDLVSFLRYERADDKGTANPLAETGGGIRHAVAFGGSQSGRYLRHFIELGMNKDTRGRARVRGNVRAHRRRRESIRQSQLSGSPAAPSRSTRITTIRRTGSRSAPRPRSTSSPARPVRCFAATASIRC